MGLGWGWGEEEGAMGAGGVSCLLHVFRFLLSVQLCQFACTVIRENLTTDLHHSFVGCRSTGIHSHQDADCGTFKGKTQVKA